MTIRPDAYKVEFIILFTRNIRVVQIPFYEILRVAVYSVLAKNKIVERVHLHAHIFVCTNLETITHS